MMIMTILQTVEIVERTWGWNWFGFILGVLAIALMIAYSISDGNCDIGIGFLCFILFIISGVIFATAKEKDSYNKYQVLLDDSVSVNELYENYEVIEQEGITFWVEDKRDDE